MKTDPVVLLFHPQELILRGLTACMKTTSVKVSQTVLNEKDFTTALKQGKPDVVLIADRLPNIDGVENAQQAIARNIPAILISPEFTPTRMAQAACIGVANFILDGISASGLAEAIKRAALLRPPAPSSSYGQIIATMQDRSALPYKGLAERESQVVRHIALALSNVEIAKSLGISTETVKEHVQNIFRKLEMPDRTMVAVWATRLGLV